MKLSLAAGIKSLLTYVTNAPMEGAPIMSVSNTNQSVTPHKISGMASHSTTHRHRWIQGAESDTAKVEYGSYFRRKCRLIVCCKSWKAKQQEQNQQHEAVVLE